MCKFMHTIELLFLCILFWNLFVYLIDVFCMGICTCLVVHVCLCKSKAASGKFQQNTIGVHTDCVQLLKTYMHFLDDANLWI